MTKEKSAIERRLERAGWTLPDTPVAPLASYVSAQTSEHHVFTAGQLPWADGQLCVSGKVGHDVSMAEAQEAARLCVVNALAAIREAIGDLDRVTQIVKVLGFVASSPDFTAQPAVIDGASRLLTDLWGDRGRHARSAVGVTVLPLDAPVEVEFVVAYH